MSEADSRKEKFIAFAAVMMEKYPDRCFANIDYLLSQPRDLQPYIAFLEVLTEHDSTVRELLKRGMGNWEELKEINDVQESLAISQFQQKLDGSGQMPSLEFAGKKGGHRKTPMRKDFGRAVFEYVDLAKRWGGLVDLVSACSFCVGNIALRDAEESNQELVCRVFRWAYFLGAVD